MTSFAQASRFARAYRKALFQPVIPVVWGVMTVFGVVAGPFGSYQLSFSGRLILWTLTISAGILTGAGLRVVVREYLGLRRFWPEAPAIAVLATAVIAPLLTLLTAALAELGHYAPTPLEIAGYVFLVSMIISSLRHAMAATWPQVDEGSPPQAPVPAAGPATVPEAGAVEVPLLARLEPGLRAPLIRLQVRDHYVDVVTQAGTGSLLLRLADAIRETAGVAGIQVHRSHWVALAAIAGVARPRGKLVLVMADGAAVPVSRSNAPGVARLGLPEVALPQIALPAETAGTGATQ